MSLPELDLEASRVALLLGGSAGRSRSGASGTRDDALLALLRRWRLAAEATVSARLGEVGLAAPSLAALHAERELWRRAARARAGTLERVSVALGQCGAEALLYKGAAVVRLCHGDPSRRPMSDVDLILAPERVDEVAAGLERQGFVRPGLDTPLHAVLEDPGAAGPTTPDGVTVELHRDVFPAPHPFEVDLSGCFQRASPTELPGVLLPDRADALLLQSVHLVLYEPSSDRVAGHLRDVALLCRHAPSVDELVRVASRRAAAAGFASMLHEVLRRSVAWAGCPAMALEASREVRCGELSVTGHAAELVRRRAAVWLAFKELDRAVARGARSPRRRVFSHRLAAALWDPTWGGVAGRLWGGIAMRGGGRERAPRLARLGRYGRAGLRLVAGLLPLSR